MNRLRQLIHEIHRRSLWQVLLIYVGASWAVLQVVDTVAGALQLPDWLEPVALVLLIVGLPIVLATAFVQEGVGTKETHRPRERAEAAPAGNLLTWRNAFGGGVLAFALWGVVAAGWVLFGGAARDAAGEDSGIEPSIAVMPCDDLSPSEDQAALAQGLAEEVSLALSGLEGVEKVSGRSSTVTLKSQGADLATIASTLGVANVLNCTVARSADQVRVTAELTDATTGTVLWSEGFQEPFTDLFAVYDIIARGVADGLRVAFAERSDAPFVTQATGSAEAHDAYLRGRYLFEQRTPERLQNAIIQFRMATELDPDYAEAFAGLADSYVLQASFGWISELGDFRERTELGLAASERATDLNPDLAIAFPSRGFGLWNLGEWDAAEEAFEEGIRLNPQYALTHQWYALLLFTTGRKERGVIEAQRAVELDPLFRQGYRNLAWALEAAGRLEEAATVYEELLSLAPDWYVGWNNYAGLLMHKGDTDAGVAAGLAGARFEGYALEEAENAFRAVAAYRRTGESQTMPAPEDWTGDDVTYFYGTTGQVDRAIERIRASIEAGRIGVPALGQAMGYYPASLVDHPDYKALMQEAGIAW